MVSVIRPKNSSVYSQNDSWADIWARTNNWISEFEFFDDEIKFLHRLLFKVKPPEDYKDFDGSFTDVSRKLDHLELRCNLFVRVIRYHQKQVEAVIENPFPQNGQTVVDDHRDLEKRIAEFMDDFRSKKSIIYKMVEDNVASDKVIHLLDSTRERVMIE